MTADPTLPWHDRTFRALIAFVACIVALIVIQLIDEFWPKRRR